MQRFERKARFLLFYHLLNQYMILYSRVGVMYFFIALCLLKIRLQRQNPLLSYVRERERKYTVNVQCSVQYILLLVYLMLVMSYCA